MILIGKKLSPTVSFILYDEENGKISQVSNDETVSMILSKKISNAKLENTVIKMTDGNLAVIDEKNASDIFYVLGCENDVYSMIDGSGEIWKMSLNTARVFFSQGRRKMTNAKLTPKGMSINRHQNFSTALRRSTEFYHHS
ncbi:MAG: hypothetical protein SOT68_08830 [Oscillospiraceae bacterium]|nr:hypothetical protein [Oscillospiraceae bacterium]MDD7279396.1 hypothetical protein [Oscillospiraceae bacterium]MDY2864281.1 hypothetical protein [Oscillospiraceae bacterium]